MTSITPNPCRRSAVPGTGDIGGNVLHIEYRACEACRAKPWITLHPGGRTESDRMAFKKFGFRAAALNSTIRKLD